MPTYYVAGLPYSDELYHFGIKGQKWGVRRFENEDGTLTALGKARYGAKRVAEGAGKVVKGAATAVSGATRKVVDHQKDKIKAKHKWMMSDEELKNRITRLQLEKQYNDLLRDSKPKISNGRKAVGDILMDGSKTIARAGFNHIANQMFREKPDKSSPSYRYLEAFKETVDTYGLPSQEELDKQARYIEALRTVEGKKKKDK